MPIVLALAQHRVVPVRPTGRFCQQEFGTFPALVSLQNLAGGATDGMGVGPRKLYLTF